MPAISVIVPVYQAEALLPQCVESVLAQTFSDWELLLINDFGLRNGCHHSFFFHLSNLLKITRSCSS